MRLVGGFGLFVWAVGGWGILESGFSLVGGVCLFWVFAPVFSREVFERRAPRGPPFRPSVGEFGL